VFVVDRVADLVVLGADPGILFVAMGVEFGESFEAKVGLAVVDEPSGNLLVMDSFEILLSLGLGGIYLGDSGKNMMSSPKTTAGMT
jgi:hypothetical protein